MENKKIWIDSEGVIKAVLLPEEPPQATALESLDQEWSLIRRQDREVYERHLTQAKQEGVRFKDQAETIATVEFNSNLGVIHCKPDTLHDLPEGYRVEIEYKYPKPQKDGFTTEYEDVKLVGSWNTRLQLWKEKGFDKECVAILKKLEPVQPTPSVSEKEEINKWKDLLDKASASYVENHEDEDVRRMFGHHYRSFNEGAIWERERSQDELTLLRAENEKLTRTILESDTYKELTLLRAQLKAADELFNVMMYSPLISQNSKTEDVRKLLISLDKYQQLKKKI